jgi:MFS family permease
MFDSEEVTEASGWLNRNVVGLAINRFLSDFGHEAGTAILPLFLAAIGAPAIALGLIEGVADALSSFAKLFGGWLGDRVERRRPWAAAGYLLTGLTTGLYGMFPWWPWTLIVRTIGWAGRGLRSPLHDALLTDSIPAAARGRAFGFDEAADTAGAVAGPLAALAIVSIGPRDDGGLHSFSVIFWLAAIPGILAALSILALVKERKHPILQGKTFTGSLQMLPSSYRRYVVGVFIFGCGDFSHTMLIMYAVQSLTPRYGASAGALAIQLYALHNLLYAVGAYPAGALADRFGKRGFLIAAYGLAALMNLLLIFAAPSFLTLVLVFVLAGAGYAFQQSLERAIVADITPVEVRSTGFGVLAAGNGVGDLVSSAIVGALWTTISPSAGFTYAFILTVVGGLVTLAALRSRGAARSA